MDITKANMYLQQFKDKVPNEKVGQLRDELLNADDKCEMSLGVVTTYNPILMIIISIFFGGLGVDRFVLGDIGLGVCKLLFGWLTLYIWPLVDIFYCYKKAKEKNYENIINSLK